MRTEDGKLKEIEPREQVSRSTELLNMVTRQLPPSTVEKDHHYNGLLSNNIQGGTVLKNTLYDDEDDSLINRRDGTNRHGHPFTSSQFLTSLRVRTHIRWPYSRLVGPPVRLSS